MNLGGKGVLVTGGARGIGRAIAAELTSAGARVVIADILQDLAEAAAAELGNGVQALQVDVTHRSSVVRMVEAACDRLGRIDVFFNNAGIIKIAPFLEVEESDWDAVMDVNAKGVFLCGQAVARHMVESGGGKIINTASIASRMGVPDGAPYAASKAAVMSLTRSMASSLAAKGVTVNAIAPGMVDTDMWALIDQQTADMLGMEVGEPRRRRARRIPIGRPAVPEDIAKVAAFLASSASDYMTGQTINIDGGNVMS